MTSAETRSTLQVVHPALEASPAAVPLAEAWLTDRHLLAVVLQAAGLLSLLERVRWQVASAWPDVRVTPEGLLAVEAVAPGLAPRPAQEMLRELLTRLFRLDPGAIPAGRGEARRSARRLLDGWGSSLAPLAADQAVAQILEAAPFLWDDAFSVTRRALAGEIVFSADRRRLWVAGPRPFRARFLAGCRDLVALRDRIAGPGARAAWDREEGGDPRALAHAGRWRAAAAVWGRRPPDSEEERVAFARAQTALGRFEAALETLTGTASANAAVLRARCQLLLGQLGGARNTLRRLEDDLPPADSLPEVAEIAVRVYTNSGDEERSVDWVARALAECRGSATLSARLVAARAAWDRNERAAMDGFLMESEEAVHDPDLAWRWYHARGLRALLDADGSGALESFARALRTSRRRLARHEAAGLWNEVGLGRAQAGDLAGAERAFLHVFRLYAGCDGPRKTTLALSNLAEIRLRRGRLAGVREILERSSAENRLAGNLRGLVQDTELFARFELAQGRAEAALALCRAARDLDVSWRRAEIAVLAARALGWLGRAAAAAAELEDVTPEAVAEQLEPEERPALWAHAGLREAAVAAIEEFPGDAVWLGVLSGESPPAPGWETLAGLEPFRAARLVFDAERLLPGAAPPHRLRAAISTFRQMGAAAFAERLEVRRRGTPLIDCAPLAELIAAAARDIAEVFDRPDEIVSPVRSGGMVGESPPLRAAFDRIARLAPGDLPLLLHGESGTGKELAARLVHRMSPRSKAPFIAVNCAAFSETLLLSDLFGHVRGAFTGADRDRAGVFETAQKGTVFLDEIGDLPPAAQGMLLRTLQEGEVRRAGESVARKVDVRVVAATHRDLAVMVGEGTFRQDLFYRLKVASVTLPPLRERGDDVLLLADHILAGLPRAGRLSREARARLLAYHWPGNVRELRNVLSVASALAGHESIGPEHLELSDTEPGPDSAYHQQVDALRRRLVRAAMVASGGNQAEAARRLGLSRQSLSYLVRQLGLC